MSLPGTPMQNVDYIPNCVRQEEANSVKDHTCSYKPLLYNILKG